MDAVLKFEANRKSSFKKEFSTTEVDHSRLKFQRNAQILDFPSQVKTEVETLMFQRLRELYIELWSINFIQSTISSLNEEILYQIGEAIDGGCSLSEIREIYRKF